MDGGEYLCPMEMMNPSDHNNTNGNRDGENVLPPEKAVADVVDCRSSQPLAAPLLSSYNDMKHKMRPLFDAIRTLRSMNVIEKGDEDITLQPIVVIGDQSSGKSSLIESLTGIGLPRICTRVPLIIRFQHRLSPLSELRLEYLDNAVRVDETSTCEWISSLTECLAGTGKDISNVPLTLVVNTNNVPADLTIIDLPGVPVDHDRSAIISDILETYIKLEDCIILHVISAATNFATCESAKILDKFDKRTLHVCTKADEATEDMVAMVSTNYMGPDYLCVRNRLGDETREEAQAKEASLFETHHLLSKIDKSMVGVCVLAQKLLLVQVEGVSNRLCALVGVINRDLSTCVAVHNKLEQQRNFTTVFEAMPAFQHVILESCRSLFKLITNVFDEFPDDTQMHWKTRLREMTSEFSKELKNIQVEEHEEFRLLEERKWSLEQAFHFLFERKVANMSTITSSFVSRVWHCIEFVIIKVLGMHAKNSYPQLFLSLKIAVKKVIASCKERFKDRLLEHFDLNKMREYTRDVQIMYSQNDLKKNMEACLEMVRKNFFDSANLDLPSMVFTLVFDMERQLVDELQSDGEHRYKPLLKESPSMSTRRWKLKNRIELLDKSKKVVENVMDEISFHNY